MKTLLQERRLNINFKATQEIFAGLLRIIDK